MPDIDIGAFSENLNQKADRNLNNTNATLPGLNAVLPNDMDYVVQSQEPTAENNYTWYRLYKSGWVKQGGKKTSSANSRTTVTLLKEMKDANYTPSLLVSGYINDGYVMGIDTLTTTTLAIWNTMGQNPLCFWKAEGYIAQD